MEIRIKQNSIIKKGVILLFAILATSCLRKEPDFTIKGESSLLKDIKVNVEMMKDNKSTVATAYYNGNSYAIDNNEVLRYKIYVSYQDKYFNTIEMDNLHSKIKGKPLNEITVVKSDNKITISYKGIEENAVSGQKELLADDVYFNIKDTREEKQKFTSFYK